MVTPFGFGQHEIWTDVQAERTQRLMCSQRRGASLVNSPIMHPICPEVVDLLERSVPLSVKTINSQPDCRA